MKKKERPPGARPRAGRPAGVMGPPLTEWKRPGVAEKIRARLERGESYRTIMGALGVGNSVIARVHRQVKAVEAQRQAAAREELIAKLMESGMSRTKATNLVKKM
jgi:hypothetical protein